MYKCKYDGRQQSWGGIPVHAFPKHSVSTGE